ncbi:trimeric intracellular cation channel family protein [Rhodovulum sp. DZ06]|uniref:trimeric intracellular cation channel family protein n=1 Tax=Rhodovulum sp. DZ06 TaxID=3425126 RepID=UPI003D341874
MTLAPLALVYWLDLLGTFVFALSGATLAVRKGMDAFGIAVMALAAALAGGVARDVMLGATPVAALADPTYLAVALAAGALAFFAHRGIELLSRPVMVLDAMGLGLFAVAGCRKALGMGLEPLPAALLGVLSAIGGGVARDLLAGETPRVLCEDVYALAALLGAGVVVIGDGLGLPFAPVGLGAAALAAGVRVMSVRRGWQAPRPKGR